MTRVVVVTLAVFLTAASAYGQCTPADKAALEQFDRTWGDLTQRGDRAALQEIYAAEFMGLSPAGTQSKAQSIDDAARQAERARATGQAPPQLKHDYYAIACTPTTATITHRNVITTVRDGQERPQQSRSVHVLEKRGGRWQVVSSTGHALNDAAILTYLEHEWNDAMVKRDVAWFEKHFADDYSGVSARTGAISNKAEEITFVKAGRRALESAELSEIAVRVEGDSAIVTGVNHEKGQDEGKPFDSKVRFTDTFIRRGGRWLVWATQGSVIPKPGAPSHN